jgi:hypothetical protein
MWIEKLIDGVVRILTPIGPRYIRLTFSQRLYFLWIFRHFDKLPQQVLSARQQKFIDELCVEHHFIALPSTMEAPIIGTLERIPILQLEETAKRPAASVNDANSPLVADLQQRS